MRRYIYIYIRTYSTTVFSGVYRVCVCVRSLLNSRGVYVYIYKYKSYIFLETRRRPLVPVAVAVRTPADAVVSVGRSVGRGGGRFPTTGGGAVRARRATAGHYTNTRRCPRRFSARPSPVLDWILLPFYHTLYDTYFFFLL